MTATATPPIPGWMREAFEAAGCVFNVQWLAPNGEEADGPGPGRTQMHPVTAPDGSYIGDADVGRDHFWWLSEHGIYAPEVRPGTRVASIGRGDGMWWGWSHRARFGFRIGSSVKRGDCAFIASNEAEANEDYRRFWDSEH
ncbi:unnamed protein product, partial [marine sediment metagenome]